MRGQRILPPACQLSRGFVRDASQWLVIKSAVGDKEGSAAYRYITLKYGSSGFCVYIIPAGRRASLAKMTLKINVQSFDAR